MGAGKIASKFNMAVVFFEIKKIKRGYYRVCTELLAENAGGMPEEEITGLYVKRLEEGIRKNPEFWTWSHRRWKHKREDLNG
jgi:KDO2-lipid IV(A) lauroyltransferase